MTKSEFLRVYSPDWYQVYRAAGLSEALWEVADAYWLEVAAQQKPALFPRVLEILAQLQGQFSIGLVTSGSKERVHRDLERTGLAGFFQVVVTADDIREPKPSPDGLNLALEQLGVKANEAVYIGDTVEDHEMAQAASVDFIGIASEFSKFGSSDEFRLIQDLGDLLEIV